MLFLRGNLKMHLGGKHQRGTTITSKMYTLKSTYFRTFYSLFYMVYDFHMVYILYGIYYILQYMALSLFSPPGVYWLLSIHNSKYC